MELKDKREIKSSLRKSFSSVIYAINDLDDKAYLTSPNEDKWSPGEILGHLILTTKSIKKGMSVPKLVLKTQFGTTDRNEKSRQELKDIYINALHGGVQAPPSVIFKGAAEKGKENMLSTFQKDLEQLIQQIDKWSEKDLSKYQLPHPAFGKLTVREMLYFTELHNYHHLKQIEEMKNRIQLAAT